MKNVGIKQLTAPIHFHCGEKNTMEVNGYRQPSGYHHSSKFLLLCSIWNYIVPKKMLILD